MIPKNIFTQVKERGRKILTLDEAIQVIKYYKIPVAESKLVKSINEAEAFATEIGYPLVLKVISPQVIHKTEAKALALDIRNNKELKSAYKKVLGNVRRYCPTAEVRGILVQKMIKKGYQVIVGGLRDLQFGPTVMVGFGGIFTEVFEDTSFRIFPFSKEDAEEMIKEIKGYKILKGYRNKPPGDLNALEEVIIKVGEIMHRDTEIREFDINPLFVLHKGVVAVDTRIVLQ